MKKFSILIFAILILLTPLFFSNADDGLFDLTIENKIVSYNVNTHATTKTTNNNSSNKVTATSTPASPSNLPRLSCGTTCSASYLADASVHIKVPAMQGFRVELVGEGGQCTFDGGGIFNAEASCYITMNADKVVTVTYTNTEYVAPFDLKITNNVVSNIVTTNGVGSSGETVSCGENCSSSYAPGTSVTITAPAMKDYTVKISGGGCSDDQLYVSNGADCTFNMNADKDVTVTYALPVTSVNLNITKIGPGNVTTDPAGEPTALNCGTNCSSFSYPPDESVTVTASAVPDYSVEIVGEGCSDKPTAVGAKASCTNSMNVDKDVTVTYFKPVILIVKNNLAPGVIVTTSSVGYPIVSCGTTCSSSYSHNTKVTITAPAVPGDTVRITGGECSAGYASDIGAGTSCTIIMDAAKEVTVTYTEPVTTYNLNITNAGPGVVTTSSVGSPIVSCGTNCSSSPYTPNKYVTVTAPEMKDYTVKISGGCSAGPTAVDKGTYCSVTMNEAKAVTVAYNYTKPVTLTIKNNKVSNKVTTDPAGLPTALSCGTTCSSPYISNSSVTVIAPAMQGYTVEISGEGCSVGPTAVVSGASCIVYMNGVKEVTVTYLLSGTLTKGAITSNSASIVVGLLKGTAFVVYIQKTGDGTGVYFSNKTGTTDDNGTKSVTFNGLSPDTTYKTFLSYGSHNNIAIYEFKTDPVVTPPVITPPVITPPTTTLDFSDLFKTVKGAVDRIANKKEGTNPGYYENGSKTQLSLVLNERYTDEGELSANEEFTLQSEIDAFNTKLKAAIDVFEKRKVAPATVGGNMSSIGGGLVPDCVNPNGNGCGFDELMQLINNLIKFLLFTVATPLAAIIIAYAGWLYLSSGGNPGDITKAKKILLNVVIGYVIGLAAWLIVNTIIKGLGINSTNPANKDTYINTFLK